MEGREQNTTKTRRSPYQEMRPEQASPDITALCSRLRTGGQSYRVCRDYRLFWLRYAHADNCRYFCCARITRTATSPLYVLQFIAIWLVMAGYSYHARTSCNDVAARNRYTPWSFVSCRGDISQLDLLRRSSHGDDLETPRKARRADRAERSTRQRIRLSEAAQRTHDRRQSRQKRDCTV